MGGGAATIRECLRRGLLDSLHIAVAPILLGAGERLFDDNPADGYRITRFESSPMAAHYVLTKT